MSKRVGLIGDNSIRYIECLLEIWNSGCCDVLIDWRIPLHKSISIMKSAGVETYYIEKHLISMLKTELNGLEFRPFKASDTDSSIVPQELLSQYTENYSEEEALIIFSSGTTGNAKGIALSHFAISTDADAIQAYMKLNDSTKIHIVKSFAHSSTLVGELLVAMRAKAIIAVSSTLILPHRLMNNLATMKVNVICVNPTLLKLYCYAVTSQHISLPKLGTIYVSGSILEIATLTQARLMFPNTNIVNVYGLTEAGPRVTSQMVGVETMTDGSVGKALRHVSIKIVNDDQECTEMEQGEIWVCTSSAYSSYIMSDGTTIPNSDEWIKTGDIGYLDKYNNLYITGRKDTMLSISSHNIFPEEIEMHVNMYNGIEDSLVVSEKHEKLVCYYCGNHVSTPKIRKFLEDKLATYEIPRQFIHIDQLPRNPNGKKKRFK